jgi:tripartite-type tricarboxylate transporter receptor subunit TctC
MAWALDYPTRPVRIIDPFPPGGVSDTLARLIGQNLSGRLGQPFVIVNRPGGATNIATEEVVRAAPDGYTLLLVSPSNVINATLYDKLSFNFIHDIAPVASIMRTPLVMLVNPAVPAKTVPEFIAYGKANPGKLNMASDGIGSSGDVAGELFKMMAGVDMTTVPYRGAPPALIDLISGRAQFMFAPMPPTLAHIRAGELRALAVTMAVRAAALPDVPTLGDFLAGYEASVLNGIGAPKYTPSEIINKLNTTINAVVANPATKAKLAALGGMVVVGSPADFGKLIAEETEKWAKVVRAANIKPD